MFVGIHLINFVYRSDHLTTNADYDYDYCYYY